MVLRESEGNFPFLCILLSMCPVTKQFFLVPYHHKEGVLDLSCMSRSALRTFAHNKSVPGALLFARVDIAASISGFVCGDVLISKSVSRLDICTSLKCFVLAPFACPLSSLSMTEGFILWLVFPQTHLVILYTVLISCLEVAVSALFARSSKCFSLSRLADFCIRSLSFNLSDFCAPLYVFMYIVCIVYCMFCCIIVSLMISV